MSKSSTGCAFSPQLASIPTDHLHIGNAASDLSLRDQGAKRGSQHDPVNLGKGRQPGDLLSQERQFVEDHGEILAGLVGLAKSQMTLGIVKVGRAFSLAMDDPLCGGAPRQCEGDDQGGLGD
jgi:hypothetical protein